MSGYREARMRCFVMLVGEEATRNNPIVYAALQTIGTHGATVEQALGTAVKCLAMQNDKMMKDLVTVACSRPLPAYVLKEKVGCFYPDICGDTHQEGAHP